MKRDGMSVGLTIVIFSSPDDNATLHSSMPPPSSLPFSFSYPFVYFLFILHLIFSFLFVVELNKFEEQTTDARNEIFGSMGGVMVDEPGIMRMIDVTFIPDTFSFFLFLLHPRYYRYVPSGYYTFLFVFLFFFFLNDFADLYSQERSYLLLHQHRPPRSV